MIETLRKPKFIGMAVFDLSLSVLGGAVAGYYLSGKRGPYSILGGLVVIPLSVVAHMLVGTDTELTTFYTKSKHRFHGLALGGAAFLIAKISGRLSLVNSANVGLAVGIGSSLYMKEFGHSFPPKKSTEIEESE